MISIYLLLDFIQFCFLFAQLFLTAPFTFLLCVLTAPLLLAY